MFSKYRFQYVNFIYCGLLLLIPAQTQAVKTAKNSEDKTPLYLAIERGSEKVFDLFLAKGVDVNTRDAEGRTPLYWAIDYNRAGMAKRLLDRGVDVNVRDAEGNTPLDWAVRNFNEEIALLIVDNRDVDTEVIRDALRLALAEESDNGRLIRFLRDNQRRGGGNRCEAVFQ